MRKDPLLDSSFPRCPDSPPIVVAIPLFLTPFALFYPYPAPDLLVVSEWRLKETKWSFSLVLLYVNQPTERLPTGCTVDSGLRQGLADVDVGCDSLAEFIATDIRGLCVDASRV